MVPVGMNVIFGNMYKIVQWVIKNEKTTTFFLIAGQNLTCTFSCDENSIF